MNKIAIMCLSLLVLSLTYALAEEISPAPNDEFIIEIVSPDGVISPITNSTNNSITPIEDPNRTNTPQKAIEPQVNPIAKKPIDEPDKPGNNGGGSSGGGSGGNEGGRRNNQTSLPLIELNTDINEENSDSESGLSKITGAVIGAIGKRPLLGIILFVLIIVIVVLTVYNRKRLKIVKSG